MRLQNVELCASIENTSTQFSLTCELHTSASAISSSKTTLHRTSKLLTRPFTLRSVDHEIIAA